MGKRQTVGMGCHSTRHICHLADTATTAGAAADKAASNKEAKYRQLANSHIFVLVAIEDRRDLEQPSSGIGAGAGPTNDSRY